jgi:pilus assembly protein CpaF
VIVSLPESGSSTAGGGASPLGPLADLLRDESLSEVLVNGLKAIYVERNGQLLLTDRAFDDENQLLRAIEALTAGLDGRKLDPANPILEARLEDGLRITVALPPVALDGPMIAIRKYTARPLEMEDLVRLGTLSVEAASFLAAAVMARVNILIAGGSSTGKTTLLNALSSYIDEQERIVTIEEASELRVRGHVCRLESVASPEQVVSVRQLVRLGVRMRPDRLVVGEVRGGEALDMLQAMNTGHDGAMSTLHANGPRDALARLETLVLMGGVDLPVRAVRQQIASALDLVVQLGRLRDGSRKVMSIVEVSPMQDETIGLQSVFMSEAAQGSPSSRGGTRLRPTGIRPRVMERIHGRGIHIPEVDKLFPPPQGAPLEAKRSTAELPGHGGPPTRERRAG